MNEINYYRSLPFERILKLLISLDKEYIPKLSDQVNLRDYSNKLAKSANFILLKNKLDIGLIAYYINKDFCFISSFGIPSNYQGHGFSQRMFSKLVEIVSEFGISQIRLEVNINNKKAIKYYYKLGFKKFDTTPNSFILKKEINES